MIVTDTCVWVEVLAATALGQVFEPRLAKPSELIIPTLVLLELRKWALRELDEDQADAIIAATRDSEIVPLTESIALLAADLSRRYKLFTADAVIYATAVQEQAPLLTADAHFKDLPGVEYVVKVA
ncbi:MAG: type II toxin-antitoxin system VapC family toxin [Burkholderiales bacterium]|nr:type II toxin-antitoxin system VapC family toxin [Burkholderiales bacterium]